MNLTKIFDNLTFMITIYKLLFQGIPVFRVIFQKKVLRFKKISYYRILSSNRRTNTFKLNSMSSCTWTDTYPKIISRNLRRRLHSCSSCFYLHVFVFYYHLIDDLKILFLHQSNRIISFEGQSLRRYLFIKLLLLTSKLVS